VKVASEPEALLQALTNGAYHFKRIGLEDGPLSQWLFSALAEAGLPVICARRSIKRRPPFRAVLVAVDEGGWNRPRFYLLPCVISPSEQCKFELDRGHPQRGG